MSSARRRPASPAAASIRSCPAGPGVERIAEEVAELFPGRRTIVLSSDFPGGTERLRRELAAIAAGEFDIVVGTQLVAKGHNFPHLTLVGVLDADIGLTSGDPRAAERTFQLLQQVTGRAGRGDRPGRALVQTWQPDHPVIAALISGDAERFYREETRGRERAGLPPFGRLAALVVSATSATAAEAHARGMAQAADPPPGVAVLGPAEAPLALIRGPLPLPPPRQDRAGGRPAGLSARLARRAARRCGATCGSRSTSTRRAFCDQSTGKTPLRAMTKTIHCIRHGQSTFNAAAQESRVDPLHWDAPLSELGRLQVAEAASRLRDTPTSSSSPRP